MKPLILGSFVPLLISGAIYNTNEQTQPIMYNDINNDLKEYNIANETFQHLKESKEANYSDLLSKVYFYEHLKAWEQKNRLSSRIDKIINDKDFLSIVNMGHNAVPFIVNELAIKPSYLVWALNFIYNFKISSDPTTTIEEASHKWVKYLSSQR